MNVPKAEQKATLTYHDIKLAAERISPYIRHTPLLRERNMDSQLDCDVTLKPEMLQITGSFKLRGALNKILSLNEDERKRGIVLTSSGNHAQACAYVGKMLGVRTTVVIPKDAPTIKSENTRAMGAEVLLWDRDYSERWNKVLELAEIRGSVIVHAYDDYDVMAGQGTIGLEILHDLPDVETIVVPISGGGLISGISTAVKGLKPETRMVGVQTAASCAYYASRQNGYPSEINSRPTIADGLYCSRTSPMPYDIIERNVDEIAVAEEEDIVNAVNLVARDAKLLAEPSACVGIAALLAGNIQTRPDEKVCVVLSGGNWDLSMMGTILNNNFKERVMRS